MPANLLEKLLGTTPDEAPRPWPAHVDDCPTVAPLVTRHRELKAELNALEAEKNQILSDINELRQREKALAERESRARSIIAGEPVADHATTVANARLDVILAKLPDLREAIRLHENDLGRARQAALQEFAPAIKEVMGPLYAEAQQHAMALRDSLLDIENFWDELAAGGWAAHNVIKRIYFAHVSRDPACRDDFQRFAKDCAEAGFIEE